MDLCYGEEEYENENHWFFYAVFNVRKYHTAIYD